MADGKMFRWHEESEIDEMRRVAFDKAVELAVRGILAMDPYIYDEDTIRAAAQTVRSMLGRQG